MSNQIFVDDRDPDLIYFGDWLLDGTGNPKIYNSTLSECQTISSGVTYQFNGTQISVFGTVRGLSNGAAPPISTYKIDGAAPVTYTAPNLTTEGDGLLFFTSDTLAAASHVLVINVTRASQGGPYMLDYLTFISLVSGSSSSSSISATPSPSSSGSSASSASSSTPSGSGSPSPSSSASDSSPTGAVRSSSNVAGPVAGGVIGGLVLLTAIILGIYFWCRRRREKGPIPDFGDSPRATTELMSQDYSGNGVSSLTRPQGYDYSPGLTTPFLATRTEPTTPAKFVPAAAESASRPSMSQVPIDSSYSQPTTSGPSGPASTSESRSTTSSKAALLSPVRPLPQPQTSDSGVRFGQGGPLSDIVSVAGELPPAYTAD